jgi:hypothetical protein
LFLERRWHRFRTGEKEAAFDFTDDTPLMLDLFFDRGQCRILRDANPLRALKDRACWFSRFLVRENAFRASEFQRQVRKQGTRTARPKLLLPAPVTSPIGNAMLAGAAGELPRPCFGPGAFFSIAGQTEGPRATNSRAFGDEL